MARKHCQLRQSFFALTLALMACYAGALDLGSYKAVKIVYGVNAVDFGPTGTQGTVVLGWRENFNAHGFGVAGVRYLSHAANVRFEAAMLRPPLTGVGRFLPDVFPDTCQSAWKI